MNYNNVGIIIRGKISDWTLDIINEYEAKFPNSEIILSTWENEKTDEFDCKVVKSIEPKIPEPHKSMINHQSILAKEGLKKTNRDVLMVCRTDQFIHSQKIFEIFYDESLKSKILVSTFPGFVNGTRNDSTYEYAMCDFCQIGYSNLIHGFWDHVPFFDGSRSIAVGRELVENYIKNVKSDFRKWKIVKGEYFLEKNYYKDFKIEWQKPATSEFYAKTLKNAMKKFP